MEEHSNQVIFIVLYLLFLVATVYGLIRFMLKSQPLISSIMFSNLIAISSKCKICSFRVLPFVVRVANLVYLILKTP